MKGINSECHSWPFAYPIHLSKGPDFFPTFCKSVFCKEWFMHVDTIIINDRLYLSFILRNCFPAQNINIRSLQNLKRINSCK